MEDWKIEKRLKQLSKNGFLTKENTEMLFKEYENDKINKIANDESEARTLLILGNMKLVYFVLNDKLGYKCANESMDEFAIGKVGLIRAVDTFNVNTGFKFSSYAIPVIKREILMHFRKINSASNSIERNKISFEDSINDDDGDEPLTIEDTLGEDDMFIKNYENQDMAKSIINNLPYLNDREQYAIVHTFGLFGNSVLTQFEIAKVIGTSRANISRCISNALKKLKVLSLREDELTREEQILRYKILKGKYYKSANNHDFQCK